MGASGLEPGKGASAQQPTQCLGKLLGGGLSESLSGVVLLLRRRPPAAVCLPLSAACSDAAAALALLPRDTVIARLSSNSPSCMQVHINSPTRVSFPRWPPKDSSANAPRSIPLLPKPGRHPYRKLGGVLGAHPINV